MLLVFRPRPSNIWSPLKGVVRLQSLRALHHTSILLSPRKKSEEIKRQEIKKLEQLRKQYENANIIQKVSLMEKLANQERKVRELKFKTPLITFKKDPMDPDYVDLLHTYYTFNLNAFIRECENGPANPDMILTRIMAEFKAKYPDLEPLDKDDILFFFHIYHDLANEVSMVSDLEFDNPKVQNMFDQFVTSEEEIPVEQIALELLIPEKTVTGWFDIFAVLMDVPYGVDKKMINMLCPEQYSLYERTSEIENKMKGFMFNLNSSDPKPKGSKDQKSLKQPFEIEVNLTPQRLFQIGVMLGLLIFFVISLYQDSYEEITFQKFTTDFLEKGLVDRLVVVNNKTVNVHLNDKGKAAFQQEFYFTIGSVDLFEDSLKHAQDQLHIDSNIRVPVVYSIQGLAAKMFMNFLPTILFLGVLYYMSKRAANMGGMGGPLGFGKLNAKKFNQETDVKIRFKDVAGMNEAKEEVMEFVSFLQNPLKYEKLGAKIPRGAILSGPPGTGKTLIAKATAGEANVPFYSVSGSEFVEMFVGVGASRVRDLFKTARENAPSIVFVDEIDAIGKSRSKGNASGSNDERETTLNQLLVEMDGFESSDHVVVLAGTNRPDILDKALMRPGRFDRHISIDNPELSDRKEIFDVHLKKIKLEENIDHDLSGRLAALTPGFSGADIANVCNEAALIAARFNATTVGLKHFELAIERVIGGVEKKLKVLSPEEKKIVAFHEAGHAICGWFLRYASPLLKVSIVPRGLGTLGYAQYLPPDQYLLNTKQLVDRMIMTLGGRVSEELFFNSVTGGAHDDFKKVTQIAQSMVLRYGMSPEIGMVNYADTRSQDNLTKPFSDETNKVIDEEIERIVSECYGKCRELLELKKHEVELVANELLSKEYITRQDMIRLLGKRPFPENNDAFDKYLDGKNPFGEAASA